MRCGGNRHRITHDASAEHILKLGGQGGIRTRMMVKRVFRPALAFLGVRPLGVSLLRAPVHDVTNTVSLHPQPYGSAISHPLLSVSLRFRSAVSVSLHDHMLVGRVGFEPTTNGLKVRCSTAELPTHFIWWMNTGIKPGKLGSCAMVLDD